MLVHSSRLLVNSIRLLLLRQESDRSLLWGAICLRIKRIFIYSARNIQIQCRIYISSQGFIYPPQDIYIQSGICISSAGFIYPVRDIYIPHGIYISSTGIYISSQGFIYPAQGFIYPAQDLPFMVTEYSHVLPAPACV